MGIYERDSINYPSILAAMAQARARSAEREGDSIRKTGEIWGNAVDKLGGVGARTMDYLQAMRESPEARLKRLENEREDLIRSQYEAQVKQRKAVDKYINSGMPTRTQFNHASQLDLSQLGSESPSIQFRPRASEFTGSENQLNNYLVNESTGMSPAEIEINKILMKNKPVNNSWPLGIYKRGSDGIEDGVLRLENVDVTPDYSRPLGIFPVRYVDEDEYLEVL